MPAENSFPTDEGDQPTRNGAENTAAGRTRWEQERELTVEFFRLVNAASSTGNLIDAAVNFFRQHSDCEAVAVRLREGNDFPYSQALGFPPEFIRAENSLCSQDCFGEVMPVSGVPDSSGTPALECRCGDVICGNFDPSKPYFTELGSFWTNSASELRARNTQEVRNTRHRGHCTESGYESIVLIPLKAGSERLGLIQFNDRRQGMFSLEAVAMWERLADFFAIGLARLRAEEARRTSEAQLKSILENLDEGLLVMGRDGRILHWNQAAVELHGFSQTPDSGSMIREFASVFEVSAMDGRVLSVDEWPANRTLRGDRLHQQEHQVRRLDRENWTRVFNYSGMPIFDAKGQIALAVITIIDVTERKKAEEALRQSEERARSLFESVSDALAVHEINPDGVLGNFISVNDAFCRLLGYNLEEMLSLSPQDIDDPESGTPTADIGKQLARNKDVLFEQILIAKDGTRVPVEIHARPFILREKLTVIATIRDISERRRAERALRESEQRLSQAVNVAGLGIFEHEHPVDILHCSPIFREFHGWDQEQVITPEMMLESVFPEDREKVASCMQQAIDPKGNGLACCELRIVRSDGIRWLLGRSETFFEGEGDARHPVRTVGAMQDITERKHEELELLASRQQLRTALDAARLGVWTRDMDSPVISCDELTRTIFGWEPDQIINFETLLNSIAPEDRERFLEKRASLLNGKESADLAVEYRIHRPDGSVRWVTVRRNTVSDSAGKPTQLIGVVRDITHRKQADEEKLALEQQFLHAQKMEAVGRLAGGIAHDFNNLLMVIRSYAEIMQECLPEKDKLRRNTQAIMKAADRASSLTGQMLAFSRKQVLSPVSLSLSAAVADAVKMLHRLIGEDIELKIFPESTWTVRADPDQISQVLMNLSVNARDAMPEGGSLTIATRNFTAGADFILEHSYMAPGDYAVFSVADTGTGIPKDIQEHMFEPFFTTKNVGKGTGLGLSTVYGIVKQSGGYLLVDSEPGRGACFTIYLPRVKDAVAAASMMNAEWLQGGTETILVVEDEEALRGSIGEFLGGLGYTVLSAESGHQALEVTREFDRAIHLMVSDVVMPKMSGRELAQILESRRPEMKTIFMSGYTDDAIVRHGVQEEGVVFLQKPFSLSTLARKIREVLGPSKESRPN